MVLHVVSFLALLNVIGHMVIGHYNIVIYFIVFALLVRYFSKNMIVVLGIPLILVNMLSLNNTSYVEGFKEGASNKKSEGFKEGASNKKSEGFKEGNTSSSDNNESFEVGRSKKSGHSIDYATTIEDAYDHLNSILGKDGIKNLTQDTERLMQQQAQLAGSLKDMGPLIEKMGPMMDSIQGMMKDMPNGGGDVMEKVKSMMSKIKQ